MISQGFKLKKIEDVGFMLLNKYNSKKEVDWEYKKPSFSFVKTIDAHLNEFGKRVITKGWFQCRQTGQYIERRVKE